MVHTVHVFGDTGGHFAPFIQGLKAIGVDVENSIIPENITIIHLGDLIHKGAYSNELVIYVNQLIENNPGRWIQLFGNHEFQHIKGAPYFWRCDCDTNTKALLRKWYREGKAKPSHFLNQPFTFNVPKSLHFDETDFESKGILFSHAGLTANFFSEIGSPVDAESASNAINNLPVDVVTQPGIMLTGQQWMMPGPAWALSTAEVFNSWILNKRTPPFHQVHGHSPAFNWQRNEWWAGTSKLFRKDSKLAPETRHIYTKVNGSLQICCDPGYEMNYDLEIQPNLTIGLSE